MTLRKHNESLKPLNFNCLLILMVIMAEAGSSNDTFKRTTYETLQNVRRQECLSYPAPECEKRDSYDDYQRNRNVLDYFE